MNDQVQEARDKARKRRAARTFRMLVHTFGMKPTEALSLMRMIREAGRRDGGYDPKNPPR